MKLAISAFQPNAEGLAAYCQTLSVAQRPPDSQDMQGAARYFGVDPATIQQAVAKLAGSKRTSGVTANRLRAEPPASSQDQAMAQLQKAIGAEVEVRGLFGDKVRGQLVQAGNGRLGLERSGQGLGLLEVWPLDSVRSVALPNGNTIHLDPMKRASPERNQVFGLYGTPKDYEERVSVAAGLLKRASSSIPGSVAEARSALRRVLEEASVSDNAMPHLTFRIIRDRTSGSFAEGLIVELERLYKLLDSARTVAPLISSSESEQAKLIETARLHFLAESACAIDVRLGMVTELNDWSGSPEGQRYLQALDEHLAKLGEDSVNLYTQWREQQAQRAVAQVPEWSPCARSLGYTD